MAPSSRRAAGAGPPSGKSSKRAPGRETGRGTSGGARGVPGPTGKRARAHQGVSRPRCRRRRATLPRFHPRRVGRPPVSNWKEKGLKAWATMQPNWLGGFGVYAAVQALAGKDVPAFVEVPLPIITNDNLDQYLARAKDFPADGYIYSPYSLEMFDQLIAAAKK